MGQGARDAALVAELARDSERLVVELASGVVLPLAAGYEAEVVEGERLPPAIAEPPERRDALLEVAARPRLVALMRDYLGHVHQPKRRAPVVAHLAGDPHSELVELAGLGVVTPQDGHVREVVGGVCDGVPVAETPVELEALLVQRRSCRVIALHVGKDAGTRERVGSQDGRVGRGRGKHSLQPRATFDEVPADLPEAPQSGGEL